MDPDNHHVDHWGEDPDYPLADWKYQVANDDTRLGYWEWVESEKEFDRDCPEFEAVCDAIEAEGKRRRGDAKT